jgi:hypothetical protein
MAWRAAVWSECGQAGAERVQHAQAAVVPVQRGAVRWRPAVGARRRQGLARQRLQGLGVAARSRRAPAWGDKSRSARGAGGRDNCHQIPCRFNGKWVGILWNRDRPRGPGGPPGPLTVNKHRIPAAHAAFMPSSPVDRLPRARLPTLSSSPAAPPRGRLSMLAISAGS